MTTGDSRKPGSTTSYQQGRKEGLSERQGHQKRGRREKYSDNKEWHGANVKLTMLIQRVQQHMWHSPAHRTQTKLSLHPQSQPWHGSPLLSPLWRSPAPVTQKRDKSLYRMSQDSFHLILVCITSPVPVLLWGWVTPDLLCHERATAAAACAFGFSTIA